MLRSPHTADQAHPRPQPVRKRPGRLTQQAYDDALLSEWILISNYTPEDFDCRFGWPEMSIEAGRHFARITA